MNAKVVVYGPDGKFWTLLFEEPYNRIGLFLEDEIGSGGEYYLDKALDVVAGNRVADEWIGNSNTVRTTKEWVLIHNFGLEDVSPVEPVIISMDAYLSILRYWIDIHPRCKAGKTDLPPFSYDKEMHVDHLTPEAANREFDEIRRNQIRRN